MRQEARGNPRTHPLSGGGDLNVTPDSFSDVENSPMPKGRSGGMCCSPSPAPTGCRSPSSGRGRAIAAPSHDLSATRRCPDDDPPMGLKDPGVQGV